MDTTRRISGRMVLALLALLVVAALALNWYNNDQQDRNVDRYVDEIESVG
jgi:hypothetical protein